MEIRVIVAGAAGVLAVISSAAFAEADLGAARELAPSVAGLMAHPRVRFGYAEEGGAAPSVDVVDADPARLTPLSQRAMIEPLVEQVAQTYGLESALLHAVIHVESSYDPNAVSKQGAQGLMQLMPGTARRYAVADAFDPEQNLHGGARYLRDLLDIFHNDLRLVLAAYNAGEYAVIRNGYRVPPLKQTLAYVSRVLQLYRHNVRAEMRAP